MSKEKFQWKEGDLKVEIPEDKKDNPKLQRVKEILEGNNEQKQKERDSVRD